MHFKRSRLAVAWCCSVAMGALVGCATASGPVAYPESWAPVDSVAVFDGCPSLAGVYSNRATDGVPDSEGESPFLSDHLVRLNGGRREATPEIEPFAWPAGDRFTHVTVTQTAESVAFAFVAGDGEQVSYTFERFHWSFMRSSEKLKRLNANRNDFYLCNLYGDEPRVHFFADPSRGSSSAGGAYMGGTNTLVFLLKSNDGSLIVHWRDDAVGVSLFLIGTHMSFDSTWWRYPALSKSR